MSKHTVLLIEDDFATATLLEHQLRRSGLRMVHYPNAENIEYHIVKHSPQIIMMDLLLPKTSYNGVDAIKYLRSHLIFCNLPIIAVTAGDSVLIDKARMAGADIVLRKPFMMAELTDVLSQISLV